MDDAFDASLHAGLYGNNKAVVSYRSITIETLPDSIVPDEKEILNRFGNPDNAAVTLPAFKDGKFAMEHGEVVESFAASELPAKQAVLDELLSV